MTDETKSTLIANSWSTTSHWRQILPCIFAYPSSNYLRSSVIIIKNKIEIQKNDFET
ncbi:MAG: hypothetical protein COA60_009740 [Robiginitomaculum sp.]|nr:hypothetical protein [Robiginitomaculum sp.]